MSSCRGGSTQVNVIAMVGAMGLVAGMVGWLVADARDGASGSDVDVGFLHDGRSDHGATGPISSRVAGRARFGPIEHLPHARLVAEQNVTLRTKRRRAGLSARLLLLIMDVVYGRERTLEKFRVLELVARVPYQAWENVAYVAVTHTAGQPGFARRVFDRVRVSRWEQNNEQWHLLILEELTADGPRQPWFKARVLPQVLAFGYYQLRGSCTSCVRRGHTG